MRALKRRAGVSLLFATSVLLAAPAAHADELLVMPYACTMVGGRPLLTRAPEQSYRVIGRREQRTHTACSPANPEMCRNWTVHRFDLECEGARVPWVSVVASVAEETTRRAWIEDGRLLLRMQPSWSFQADDPCARPRGFDDRFGFGRMRRYCADRRAMAPPPIVEMPFGFAPMLGIDGIFVQSSGPSTGPAMPSPPPVAATPPPPPKVARAEPPQPPRAEPASVACRTARAAARADRQRRIRAKCAPTQDNGGAHTSGNTGRSSRKVATTRTAAHRSARRARDPQDHQSSRHGKQRRPRTNAAPDSAKGGGGRAGCIKGSRQSTGQRSHPAAAAVTTQEQYRARQHFNHGQPAQRCWQSNDRHRCLRRARARPACGFCTGPAPGAPGRYARARHRLGLARSRARSACPAPRPAGAPPCPGGCTVAIASAGPSAASRRATHTTCLGRQNSSDEGRSPADARHGRLARRDRNGHEEDRGRPAVELAPRSCQGRG